MKCVLFPSSPLSLLISSPMPSLSPILTRRCTEQKKKMIFFSLMVRFPFAGSDFGDGGEDVGSGYLSFSLSLSLSLSFCLSLSLSHTHTHTHTHDVHAQVLRFGSSRLVGTALLRHLGSPRHSHHIAKRPRYLASPTIFPALSPLTRHPLEAIITLS